MQAENSSPSQAMTVQQQLNPPQSEQAGHGDSSGYYMVQHRPEGEHGASSSSAPTGYSGGAPSHGQIGSPAVLSPISGSGGAGMGQGLTTYPPRRKAIRAAQVRPFVPGTFGMLCSVLDANREMNRPAMLVEHGKRSVMKDDRAAVSVRSHRCLVCTEKYRRLSRLPFLICVLYIDVEVDRTAPCCRFWTG